MSDAYLNRERARDQISRLPSGTSLRAALHFLDEGIGPEAFRNKTAQFELDYYRFSEWRNYANAWADGPSPYHGHTKVWRGGLFS